MVSGSRTRTKWFPLFSEDAIFIFLCIVCTDLFDRGTPPLLRGGGGYYLRRRGGGVGEGGGVLFHMAGGAGGGFSLQMFSWGGGAWR